MCETLWRLRWPSINHLPELSHLPYETRQQLVKQVWPDGEPPSPSTEKFTLRELGMVLSLMCVSFAPLLGVLALGPPNSLPLTAIAFVPAMGLTLLACLAALYVTAEARLKQFKIDLRWCCKKGTPWQCPSCDYDLYGSDSDICPECGESIQIPTISIPDTISDKGYDDSRFIWFGSLRVNNPAFDNLPLPIRARLIQRYNDKEASFNLSKIVTGVVWLLIGLMIIFVITSPEFKMLIDDFTSNTVATAVCLAILTTVSILYLILFPKLPPKETSFDRWLRKSFPDGVISPCIHCGNNITDRLDRCCPKCGMQIFRCQAKVANPSSAAD